MGGIYIKKRLLFVNGHLNIGGVERSLVDLLKAIDYDEYEVDLVLFEGLGDYIDEIPKTVNIKFYDLTNTYGAFLKCIFNNLKNKKFKYALMRIIFNLQRVFNDNMLSLAKIFFYDLGTYDCAIAYREGFCAEFVAYVINSRKKILWWHNGVYEHKEYKANKKFERYCSNFNYIVAVSNGCKDMILQHSNISSEKIIVIPNIIDHNSIHKKALKKIEGNLFNKDFINIVSIGRLSFEKSMINCVYTCKKLVDKGYKIKWYLIGDGPEYSNIYNEIEKNKLEESIILLGNKLNPYPYLSQCDIYVHPSTRESMSITIIEALSLYKPVVAAKSMGPSEFIINKKNGLMVEPNVEGLYEGILLLLNNSSLAKEICINNEELLLKYAPQTVIEQIEKLINVN